MWWPSLMLHFGFQKGKLWRGRGTICFYTAFSNSQNYLSSARSSFSTSGQKRFFMNMVSWFLPSSIAFPMDTFLWLPLGLYRVLQSLKPSKPSIKWSSTNIQFSSHPAIRLTGNQRWSEELNLCQELSLQTNAVWRPHYQEGLCAMLTELGIRKH